MSKLLNKLTGSDFVINAVKQFKAVLKNENGGKDISIPENADIVSIASSLGIKVNKGSEKLLKSKISQKIGTYMMQKMLGNKIKAINNNKEVKDIVAKLLKGDMESLTEAEKTLFINILDSFLEISENSENGEEKLIVKV